MTHGPLLLIVAESTQERRALTADLPATSPILLARDIAQARQALDQLPGAASGSLQLRSDRLSLTYGPREIRLTRLEFALLAQLLPRVGEAVTYEQLSQVCWGTPYLGNGAHMHAAIGRLRSKLADIGAPVVLHAVRGVGFRLDRHGSDPAHQGALGS